jgi:hypothetical protein
MDNNSGNAKERMLDLDALDAQADEEQSKEAYHPVSSGSDFRLGVVATASADGELVHSIELLVCFFSTQSELRLPLMERAIQLAGELKDRGYLLIHEDDGWVSCGRTLPRSEVAGECAALIKMIMSFREDRQRIDKGTGR